MSRMNPAGTAVLTYGEFDAEGMDGAKYAEMLHKKFTDAEDVREIDDGWFMPKKRWSFYRAHKEYMVTCTVKNGVATVIHKSLPGGHDEKIMKEILKSVKSRVAAK